MSVPAEMPAATPATVHTQIESGSTNPIYLLLGKDEVEKLELAHAFDALVDEELRAFNVERIHAGEWTTGDRLAAGVASVVAAVRTLPMMSPRRVVLILQGEGLLVPRRESEAAARALEELERLVKRPEPQTTLVICARSLDKRSRIYKLLAKEATVVECGVLEDRADAERWVKHRVAAAGLDIAPGAVRLLGVLCGPDIKRLRNDLERLLLYTRGCQTITVEDVREIAGPAALQDDWAMTNAIEGGHAGDALRQLALMLDAGAPPEKVLGQLGWLVRTKFPALASAGELRGAVEALFRTDLNLKRSAGDARVLLERLVYELCSAKRAGQRRT